MANVNATLDPTVLEQNLQLLEQGTPVADLTVDSIKSDLKNIASLMQKHGSMSVENKGRVFAIISKLALDIKKVDKSSPSIAKQSVELTQIGTALDAVVSNIQRVSETKESPLGNSTIANFRFGELAMLLARLPEQLASERVKQEEAAALKAKEEAAAEAQTKKANIGRRFWCALSAIGVGAASTVAVSTGLSTGLHIDATTTQATLFGLSVASYSASKFLSGSVSADAVKFYKFASTGLAICLAATFIPAPQKVEKIATADIPSTETAVKAFSVEVKPALGKNVVLNGSKVFVSPQLSGEAKGYTLRGGFACVLALEEKPAVESKGNEKTIVAKIKFGDNGVGYVAAKTLASTQDDKNECKGAAPTDEGKGSEKATESGPNKPKQTASVGAFVPSKNLG